MEKDKNHHIGQVSSEGGKPVIVLLLSRHFKVCSLPADAGLRLLRKYHGFKRNPKRNI